MSLFPESWKRINRAAFHLKAFQAEWERVANPNAYELVPETNSDRTAGFLRAKRKISSENSLALELGEFFYQLRAALDATIYQAALFLQQTNVPANENRLEFPICDTPERFKKSAFYKGKLPDDLKAWIEAMQPYKIAETSDRSQVSLIQRLSLIHDCSRKDRHRQLHVVGAFPTHLRCDFEVSPPTVEVGNGQGRRVNFLESDDPFFFFDIRGVGPGDDCHIKLKSALLLEVSVEQIPVPSGSRLDEEVKAMGIAVEYILRYFEDGFVV